MSTEQSKAEQFVAQMGWATRLSGTEHLAVQSCPFCLNSNFKFYIHIGGEKDGVWDCKVCGETGNLYQLKDKLGVQLDGTISLKDSLAGKQTAQPLPDFTALHNRLLTDEAYGEVLDYAVAGRGFSMTAVEHFKLGASKVEDTFYLVIPYFDRTGNPVFYKGRSVPPAKKAFRAPAGREARLFNEAVLQPGMDEICITEGECDVIALHCLGYETAVGVPGANNKKASWIEMFDRLEIKKIYLLYDNDKVGKDAARDMAMRIGIDKCYNIELPQFEVMGSDGPRAGKDINDWLLAGRTLEEFLAAKDNAQKFNIQGIQSVAEVLQELEEELEGKGSKPTFTTCWEPLNDKVGGWEEGDLVGWIAEGKIGKTTMLMNLMHWYAAECGYVSHLECHEMPAKRMVRKWVSHVTQTDDSPGNSQITTATVKQALQMAQGMKADLLFGFHRVNKADELFELFYQAIRRYGVKIFCFDNLQLLTRSVEHQAQETSKLTKLFKAFAMEMKVLMHLIIQPNRVAEGVIVSARNAMGSSAIEKDVDMMICLHRKRVVGGMKDKDFNGYLDTTETFEPHLLANVDLARYAPGGACTLWMDGAKSTVRVMNEQDKVNAPESTFGVTVEEPVAV